MKLFPKKRNNILYMHCNETPLDVFIDVLVNKNLQRLIKYGKPNMAELNNAWEILFAEYCEISNTPEYKYLIKLSRDIGSLNSKLLAIRLCIKVLSVRHSQKCIATLKRFGYNYKFDIRNIDQYLNDLNAVSIKSKTIEISLEQAVIQYNKLVSDNDEKPSEALFDKNLIELSKFMGFRLNRKEITVSEYVLINSRMQKEIEMLASKGNNKKYTHGQDHQPTSTA